MVDEEGAKVWVWADNDKGELLEVRVLDVAGGAGGGQLVYS